MGVLTIVLDDETEKELRKLLRDKFGKEKGEISKFVEIAVKNYIQELKREDKIYFAFKGEEKVAEAKSLEELVKTLKEKGLDFRGLRILRSDFKQEARFGVRLKKL
ncbi:MAG: ribbon-helix-helix domain-containing protein [Archaeoglobaceae archaeon]